MKYRQNRGCQLDKRKIDDMKLKSREKIRAIKEKSQRESGEKQLKRALAKMWAELPPEVKEQMKADIPEVVAEMDKIYGGNAPQGNPWGTFTGKKGR